MDDKHKGYRGGLYGAMDAAGGVVLEPVWTQLASNGEGGFLALDGDPLDERPDEIVAVECKDEAAAKAVVELLKTRVQNQSELFASYNPDEAAKLDKAIVKSSGKYAVLVVCDDYDKAESILKDAGF